MSHDLTVPGKPVQQGVHDDPERRSGVERRRSEHDRREEIRFELSKKPRRSGRDRRKSAWDRVPSR